MFEWLRPLFMIFYAPGRAMSEVRDRAPLAQAALLAFLAQDAHALYAQWPYLSSSLMLQRGGSVFLAVLWESALSLLLIAFFLVPITIFVSNLFERRTSFRLAIQQEYTAVASAIFYALAAASLMAIPLLILARTSGFEAAVIEQSLERVAQWQHELPPDAPPLANPRSLSQSFALLLKLPLFGLWTVVAVREVFRTTWLRAVGVILVSSAVMLLASPLMAFISVVLASPFLLLLLFFLLRGYISEMTRTQRARASFKQNLEAATLNPADASAHYNLGLIHLERKELDQARERFERAITIDADEIDAHYQLGRIARAQNRLPEAIKHFEQVVIRAPQHAQHEIWREIGATYIAAGQFADAHNALERFLEDRESDPEGLYLMGRALAGLGRQDEAAESMRACIEAVKTAPAYKYRAEKRWLNEAQQFLRSQA